MLVYAIRKIAPGYFCNNSVIWCLKILRAMIVRVGNRWSWFWPRVSIWYNSLLNVNIVPKYSGRDLFTNLYQNFKQWTSNISPTFCISSSLNNGSVWALYLQFVIMRRARFCSLNIHSTQNPSILYQTADEIKSKNHVWVSWLKIEGITLAYSLYLMYERFYWQS